MSGEVPVWVGGTKKWVTGLTKKTTCEDVVKALVESEKRLRSSSDEEAPREFVMIERWRKVERPLEPKTKLLKAWNAWGEEQPNVKLSLKATNTKRSHHHASKTKLAAESLSKNTRSRRSHAKVKWRQLATVHPKKLLLLQQDGRKGSTETMERLMKMILVQGETIQEQLKKLSAKEEQIESYEQRLHDDRVQTLGANYLLDTYMQTTKNHHEPEVHHQQPSTVAEDEAKIREIQHCIQYYERLFQLSDRLEREESTIQLLTVELESACRERGAGEEGWRGETEVEEAKCKVERMSAINQRNLIDLEENEMQLAKLSVWLEDKSCYVRHLECDLREAEDESRHLTSASSSITSSPLQIVDSVVHSQDIDSNSDTGLSSLHSSSDDVILDTLV